MTKKRELLKQSPESWKKYFQTHLPEIWDLVQFSSDALFFEKQLVEYLDRNYTLSDLSDLQRKAISDLEDMIRQSDSPVYECSEEKEIDCQTLRYLWEGLTGDPNINHPDFYLELYILFKQLEGITFKTAPEIVRKNSMQRWESGLDPKVKLITSENKRRIVRLLIKEIEKFSDATPTRYHFRDTDSYEDKYAAVLSWWEDYRFHLKMALRHPEKLNQYLDYSLSKDTMQILRDAYAKGIPFFITPYYLSLLNTSDKGFNDRSVRDYVIYSRDLVETFGSIKAWEKEDVVQPGEPNAAGWLLPDTRNIHRRYPEVAILIPETMGRACGGLCASCQRMYGFQKGNLNFDLDKLKPKQNWLEKIRKSLDYFENDSQLRDILITGGDALMSQNKTLKQLLDEVYEMALRKKEANSSRSQGEKYAQIRRIRLGTRLPVYLPFRVNSELLDILSEFRQKAMQAGISQFIIQTHFQSPLEMTPETAGAIRKLQLAGWLVVNQQVFTSPASRFGHSAKLRRVLNENGVITYYTFSVKGFDENREMFTPNARSVQEQQEEKIYGKMSAQAITDLMNLLKTEKPSGDKLLDFMQRHDLPFIASDRSVMNLPGIGKSMTFRMAGIGRDGRRILAFSHDSTRRHSPVINHLPEVFIIERKSIGEYLRQMENMGENIALYNSIWYYRNGMTEARFPIYEYPAEEDRITDHISHQAV